MIPSVILITDFINLSLKKDIQNFLDLKKKKIRETFPDICTSKMQYILSMSLAIEL